MLPKFVRQSVVFASCLWLLQACSLAPTQKPDAPLGDESLRQSLAQFVIEGKLGVRAPSDSGSANIKWQQLPGQFEIILSGPMGIKRTSINGDATGVVLTQADRQIRADTAEELIFNETGWQFPVSQLAYWIRALPAPVAAVGSSTRDTEGRLTQLQQLDWNVEFSDYRPYPLKDPVANPLATQLAMPHKIVATRAGYRITLVARKWQLAP